MDFSTIITNAVVTTGIIGFIGWVARTWIKEKISKSIKHEYDLDLAKFKSDLATANALYI
jgi:hypothetical protein